MFLNFLQTKKNLEIPSRYDFKANLKRFNKLKKTKKLIIGVTVGRSGMKWVLNILEAHKKVYGAGGGERNSLCESFYRYAIHNKFNVDQSALLNSIICETINDWKNNDVSFQLSPYFSHSIKKIDQILKPHGYIWGVNDFKFTVQSFYDKNWYNPDYNISISKKVPGFSLNDLVKPSHFFGRIAPTNKFYNKWKNFTRIGKIAWYVNYTNKIIFDSLKKIDRKKKFFFILANGDQNYNFYLSLAKWINFKDKLSKKNFLKIKFKKPGRIGVKPHVSPSFNISENKIKKFNRKELKEMNYFLKEYNKIYKKLVNSINY